MSLKTRKQAFDAAYAALVAATRQFVSALDSADAFKSLDIDALSTHLDGVNNTLADLDTKKDDLIDYDQVTVAGNVYDIVQPEVIHNGETVTAEEVDADSDLAEELVESGSTMLRIHKPTAEFSADDVTVSAGADVEFTDESTNAPTSWSWDFGDGESSTEQNPTHAYENPGTYTVELVATNAGGSDTKIRTTYITVS